MEYEDLLTKAAALVPVKDDLLTKNEGKIITLELRRLLYVTAFGIAQYKSSNNRINKPFNPILGETFELKRPTFKFFAE